MGLSSVLGALVMDDQPIFANAFLFVWLIGWIIGGFFVIATLLWSIAGLELIKVDGGILEIGKEIFNIKRSKKYQIDEIKHLAISPNVLNDVWGLGHQRNFFGLSGGTVKFDYGLKTFKFGAGIDEAEGRLLIESFKLNPNFKESNFA